MLYANGWQRFASRYCYTLEIEKAALCDSLQQAAHMRLRSPSKHTFASPAEPPTGTVCPDLRLGLQIFAYMENIALQTFGQRDWKKAEMQ